MRGGGWVRRPFGRRGVAALEFALLAPALLLLTLGGIFFGFYVVVCLAVTQVAGEAARASVAGLTAPERSQLAQASAAVQLASYGPLLLPSLATVTAQPVAGNPLLFQVSVTYNFLAGGLPALLPVPVSNPSATAVVSCGGY